MPEDELMESSAEQEMVTRSEIGGSFLPLP